MPHTQTCILLKYTSVIFYILLNKFAQKCQHSILMDGTVTSLVWLENTGLRTPQAHVLVFLSFLKQSFLALIGLIMVPNGKLIGKQLGDRYPREDMLLEEHTNGPGGRLSGLMNNSTLTQGLKEIFCTHFSSL